MSFVRTFRSITYRPMQQAGALGVTWRHNHSTSLKISSGLVQVISSEGYIRRFALDTATSTWRPASGADSLVKVGTNWRYYRSDDDSTLIFGPEGRLLTFAARNGWTNNYAYNAAGQLVSVSNSFGRTLTLAYTPIGLLSTVTAPDGRVVNYIYDNYARLSQVVYPDGKARTFFYENGSFPQSITGIGDESNSRFATFAYNTEGKAVQTELSGGVSRYKVSYPSSVQASVLDPVGTSRTFSFGTLKGKLAVLGGGFPSAEGESDAASRAQDANGLVTSETDFKGVVTTTSWDTGRRLPLSVTRGVGTPEAVTTATQWHSTFSLPTLVTEPGRTTSFSYDAV
ncbi:MAG: RHS repeat protein, partial [Proteobacteria bacterium]|nr:RHS repeat protein [Pseudomonadota bacterium]